MNVVTSGSSYLDIDAYGAMVAVAELDSLMGVEAVAGTNAPLNESITPTIRSWKAPVIERYQAPPDARFTLVDVSDPAFFDPMVDLERVGTIIDHHPGHEAYWQERIGSSAQIEKVGAACTQVAERWWESKNLANMSQLSARLLMTGILDNTLNFGAQITDSRDHDAYHLLIPIAELPDDWPAQYFEECQAEIEADLKKAIENDLKTGMKNLPSAVGQLVVWDAKKIIDDRFDEVKSAMDERAEDWFVNAVSIGDGRSYFLATRPDVQEYLSKLLDASFDGNVAVADRLWLRKEIHAEALAQ